MGLILALQLYSEDLITLAITTAKYQLESCIYPLAEVHATKSQSPWSEALANAAISRLVDDLFQITANLLPKIASLFKSEQMSESIMISATYVAIGPFFVDFQAGDAKGKAKETSASAALKTLRLNCLGLLRIVSTRRFANQGQGFC